MVIKLYREPSISTTTTSETIVVIDDIDTTDDVNSRKMVISRWYDKGTTMEKSKESIAMVRRAFRNIILPQMKFIRQGKGNSNPLNNWTLPITILSSITSSEQYLK